MLPQKDDVPVMDQQDRELEQGGLVLRLHAEEVVVSRRQIERAVVRVATTTRTIESVVQEDLVHERVEIERVPVGRYVDAPPAVREEDGLTVMPVVEEVLIVERRLLLKEEVHIRRIRTTEQHQETVQLRHQEASITRIPAAGPDAVEAGISVLTPDTKTRDY